jgi:hypothetical protein
MWALSDIELARHVREQIEARRLREEQQPLLPWQRGGGVETRAGHRSRQEEEQQPRQNIRTSRRSATRLTREEKENKLREDILEERRQTRRPAGSPEPEADEEPVENGQEEAEEMDADEPQEETEEMDVEDDPQEEGMADDDPQEEGMAVGTSEELLPAHVQLKVKAIRVRHARANQHNAEDHLYRVS